MLKTEPITICGNLRYADAVQALSGTYPDKTRYVDHGRDSIGRRGRFEPDGAFELQRSVSRWSDRDRVGVVVRGHLSRTGTGIELHGSIIPMRTPQLMMAIPAVLLIAVGVAILGTTLPGLTVSGALADTLIAAAVAAGVWYFARRALVVTGRVGEDLRNELYQLLSG